MKYTSFGVVALEIIEVSGLSKNYNGFTAVNNIDFSVEKGEVFGFLGPNGAGKTTTINMLTGLARPTSGRIDIAGKDGIREIKKVQRLIGIVPDESNLYDDLSGYENLVFCSALYGVRKSEREEGARSLLKQFGLDDTGKRPFKAFSKGMKRKLTIAAGLIHDPEILFLDEPTTGIDVESARQIRSLVRELNERGTTIFLTTHYIEEAERLCDRIGFIVGGRIVKIGTVADLMKEAQKENIVEFTLGSDPVDLKKQLIEEFRNVTINLRPGNTLRITSLESIKLMPFMSFFGSRGVDVYEAKIVRPSLEEVFVEVTGIEVEKMKTEKEGKKK